MALNVPVTNADKQTSYYKYFLRDLAPGDPALYAQIKNGPWDNQDAHRIEDRNDLFKPGVTGEMFDCWFTWHPMDRLRYAIWDHDDHYDVYLEDPAKARDFSKSVRERHWGSVHHVWEDIGLGNAPLVIHFRRPGELGFDESLIDTEHCSALICANSFTVGCIPDGVSIPPMVPATLLNHNVKEFANLAAILPAVYAEEKDNW